MAALTPKRTPQPRPSLIEVKITTTVEGLANLLHAVGVLNAADFQTGAAPVNPAEHANATRRESARRGAVPSPEPSATGPAAPATDPSQQAFDYSGECG